MNDQEGNAQLNQFSRRIADERDPETLIALAKELDQWLAEQRGDADRKEIPNGQ